LPKDIVAAPQRDVPLPPVRLSSHPSTIFQAAGCGSFGAPPGCGAQRCVFAVGQKLRSHRI
jgi:hypothetical protein